MGFIAPFLKSLTDARFSFLRPRWATASQFMPQMVCIRLEDFQILNAIVIIHVIHMVNNLSRQQVPPKVLLHH